MTVEPNEKFKRRIHLSLSKIFFIIFWMYTMFNIIIPLWHGFDFQFIIINYLQSIIVLVLAIYFKLTE